MPNILTLKPDDIDTIVKRSNIQVNVVGCDRKGILYAYAFAQAGFKVSCLDADPNLVKKLSRGKTPFAGSEVESKIKGLINSGQLSVTGELKKTISRSDIVIVTVPAKVEESKVDFSQVIGTLKQVGAALHTGMLLAYGEVASLGFIGGAMRETLENTSGLKADQDFILAYVPIGNAQPEQLVGPVPDLKLQIALAGKTGQEIAMTIFRTFTKDVVLMPNVKIAEIATLFMAAQQDAMAALACEFAIFCENADIDYFEMLRSSGYDDGSFLPVIDNEENKNEAYLLLESAENLNSKLRLPALVRQINEEIVKHAVSLTQDALRNGNKTLRRAKIAVLGGVKPNSNGATFIKSLSVKGAKIALHNPVSKNDTPDLGVETTSLNEAVEGADCIVILTREEQFKRLNLRKLKALTKPPSVILDLAGMLDPKAVEAEGFIYRGLGRGTR